MTSVKASVIVPVYNDPNGIRTTLESLLDQQFDSYEIIPVDNNSTDATADVIHDLATAHPERIRPCAEREIQSSYAARNTGIEHATGDVLLFLDADMWVEDSWVEDLVWALETRGCEYIGCHVEVVTSENPNFPERYEHGLSFPVESYLTEKRFAPTCALAVKRNVITEVGSFDARLISGGDKEFGQRVYRAGFDQGYADSVTAYHPARSSYSALISKAIRIGRGRAQLHRYHPQMAGPHLLHPVHFLPPNPRRLAQECTGTSGTLLDLPGFYMLEFGLKLVQAVSSLQERVAG